MPTDPCPIAPVLALVSSRWNAPILWFLRHHGPLRFTELRAHLGPITPKVLTHRLRQLERDGLISRTTYPEAPPRVEYDVTALARTLTPAFAPLAQWSATHMPQVHESRSTYDRSNRPRPS